MTDRPTFFDFAAEVGLTKHIGGREATDRLAALCHIGPGKTVLDVGCGVGVTPCYLARTLDCRVVGVDIKPRMIERARERAAREKVSARVEFRVADAQDLPFENDFFDAVITESVTAFPEDKLRAVAEYARVTRPGGYVGLNETAWLEFPPPPEVVAWIAQDSGTAVELLTPEGWVGLLRSVGLREISFEILKIDLREESRGIVQRYGLAELARIIWRTFLLYSRSKDYRSFVRGVRKVGLMPPDLDRYFGWGLFIGRK